MSPPVVTPPRDPRPLEELAQGLTELYVRLQPAAPGADPSPGDRVDRLAGRSGLAPDTARRALEALEDTLRWLDGAMETLDPWMVQVDVVLAFGGLVTAATDGAAEAGKGLVALGQALVVPRQTPAQAFTALGGEVELHEAYLALEDKLGVIPPPEDLAAVRVALAPLLAPSPPTGARSLPSLRARLAPRRTP